MRFIPEIRLAIENKNSLFKNGKLQVYDFERQLEGSVKN